MIIIRDSIVSTCFDPPSAPAAVYVFSRSVAAARRLPPLRANEPHSSLGQPTTSITTTTTTTTATATTTTTTYTTTITTTSNSTSTTSTNTTNKTTTTASTTTTTTNKFFLQLAYLLRPALGPRLFIFAFPFRSRRAPPTAAPRQRTARRALDRGGGLCALCRFAGGNHRSSMKKTARSDIGRGVRGL